MTLWLVGLFPAGRWAVLLEEGDRHTEGWDPGGVWQAAIENTFDFGNGIKQLALHFDLLGGHDAMTPMTLVCLLELRE